MKKLTFEEFIAALKKESAWIMDTDINKFVTFVEKYRLKTRFINAVNAKYKDYEYEAFVSEITCAFPSDMISCFIDWNKSTDDNWSEINVQWQEYKGNN